MKFKIYNVEMSITGNALIKFFTERKFFTEIVKHKWICITLLSLAVIFTIDKSLITEMPKIQNIKLITTGIFFGSLGIASLFAFIFLDYRWYYINKKIALLPLNAVMLILITAITSFSVVSVLKYALIYADSTYDIAETSFYLVKLMFKFGAMFFITSIIIHAVLLGMFFLIYPIFNKWSLKTKKYSTMVVLIFGVTALFTYVLYHYL